MTTYKRHWFPPDIISYAVWLYYRFNLSHRDIEDLLAERGSSSLVSRSVFGVSDSELYTPEGWSEIIVATAIPFTSMKCLSGSTASSITYGGLWIRMARWWMCICRRSGMVLQRNGSSGDCCDPMMTNPERSWLISYAVIRQRTGKWCPRRFTIHLSMPTTGQSNHMKRPG